MSLLLNIKSSEDYSATNACPEPVEWEHEFTRMGKESRSGISFVSIPAPSAAPAPSVIPQPSVIPVKTGIQDSPVVARFIGLAKSLFLVLLCSLFTLPTHAVLKTEIPIKFMKASLGINIGTHFIPEPQAGETPFEMFAFGWAPKGSSYQWSSSDPTVFTVDSPTEQRTKLTQIKAGVAKLQLSVMVTAPDGSSQTKTFEETLYVYRVEIKLPDGSPVEEKIFIGKDEVRHFKVIIFPEGLSSILNSKYSVDWTESTQTLDLASTSDGVNVKGKSASSQIDGTSLKCTLTVHDNIESNYSAFLKLTVVATDSIETRSDFSPNSPQIFLGHQHNSFFPGVFPNPGQHLVIFYKDVISSQFAVKDFRVSFKVNPKPSSLNPTDLQGKWMIVEDNPKSGILNKTNSLDVNFENPKLGGVYAFNFKFTGGSSASEVNIVLPLAGAEIGEVIRNDLIRADNFARRVNERFSTLERVLHLPEWFWAHGNGDYLGRPENFLSPSVAFYNQVNDVSGMGAVGTWGGKPVRVAKCSNFMYAYAMRQLGFDIDTIITGGIAGTNIFGDDPDTLVTYRMGFFLADLGLSFYDNVLNSDIGEVWGRGTDDKHKRLWPNSNRVTDGFTSPGFLDIEDL